MVMYLRHLRPPPRIWRTRPELKKTSVPPPSAGDGVDLWNRRTAAAGVETGMGMLCWEVTEKRRGDYYPAKRSCRLRFLPCSRGGLPHTHRSHVLHRWRPHPAKRSIQKYPAGLGRRCFAHGASHNTCRDMSSNRLPFAYPGPVSRDTTYQSHP
jgi:hypothetical protein